MKARASLLPLGTLLALSALVLTAAPPAAEAAKAQGMARGRDRTPPTIVCPGDLAVEATGAYGTNVWFQATATDDMDPSPTIAYSVRPGSLFPIGTTTVSVTATDWRDNSSSCTFTVTVQDTTAPSCPSDMTREATGADGAAVTFAVGDVDPSPTIVSSHESGSRFPIGTTTVTLTATDWAGNSTTCTFEVTVQDTRGPSPTCRDLFLPATEPAGAVATFASTAWDAVDPSPTVAYSHDSGSMFPVGTTTVTVTATDDFGNQGSCTFDVTVFPFDDDPTDGPFVGNYTWAWVAGWFLAYDWDWNPIYEPVTWYEWSITVAPDGTISGTGRQYYVWVWDGGGWDDGRWYLYPMLPEETGALTGHVSDGGLLHADGSYYEIEADGSPWDNYASSSFSVSLTGLASLDADGNLLITDSGGNVTVWQKQ